MLAPVYSQTIKLKWHMAMLQILEYRPGRETPIRHTINLARLPATIGRWDQATYPVAVGMDPRLVFVRSISRIHATVYREGDQIMLKDGGDQPSRNGLWRNGVQLNRPVRIYEGCEYALVPRTGDYGLLLKWPVTEPSTDYPTLGLEDVDSLKAELKDSDEQIATLTTQVDQLTIQQGATQDTALSLQKEVITIKTELRTVKAKNLRQDSRLKQQNRWLLGLAIVVLGATSLLLFGDSDTLELICKTVLSIIGIVSAIAGFNHEKTSQS
ncbi:FHA domain-containing protein [Leptothoe sp. LEGE 181152]|nr:FHA domain-containing protein [Leptothoe sp. LEGE 181152]